MARDFARQFYSSEAWNKCRDGYKKSVGGLCEDCLKDGIYTPGEIVHHINPITPQTVSIPEIALDWANLKLVCRLCHAKEHGKKQKRFTVDEVGRVEIR